MNICIVGFGAVGPVHAESLNLIKNVNIYGICDILKERADEGAEKYGCKAFYSFEDCLSDENIDSIHICTPHYLHFEMIKSAVWAGKKVVCEKPVTMKKDEFEYLLKHHGDGSVFPIIQNRTNKCIKELKSIIDNDNTLGKLIAVKGILTWYRDADYYNSAEWRGTKLYEGGGVLINQAVHTLDLMIYLGGELEKVTATMTNKSLEGIIEVEDTVDAYMLYKNGAKGIFYATNAYPGNSPIQLELIFENTSFRYISGKLYRDDTEICVDDKKFFGKEYWGAGHERMFYDLYVNDKKLTLNDIKATMQAMFAIYESADIGKEIKL